MGSRDAHALYDELERNLARLASNEHAELDRRARSIQGLLERRRQLRDRIEELEQQIDDATRQART